MTDDFIQAVASAISTHEPLPPFESALTLSEAYALQPKIAVEVSPAGFAGVKAGITSEALQKNFGIDHALLGRLYECPGNTNLGRIDTGTALPHVDGRLIECEIGLILDEQLRPAAAALTIEIAHLKFASPGDATAANLVAANVATDAFIMSEPLAMSAWDSLTVRLTRDDEVINEADLLSSLGGPESALKWIVEESNRQGITLAAGDLVMTGACGRVVPAARGHYGVTCEPFQSLTFSIQ